MVGALTLRVGCSPSGPERGDPGRAQQPLRENLSPWQPRRSPQTDGRRVLRSSGKCRFVPVASLKADDTAVGRCGGDPGELLCGGSEADRRPFDSTTYRRRNVCVNRRERWRQTGSPPSDEELPSLLLNQSPPTASNGSAHIKGARFSLSDTELKIRSD